MGCPETKRSYHNWRDPIPCQDCDEPVRVVEEAATMKLFDEVCAERDNLRAEVSKLRAVVDRCREALKTREKAVEECIAKRHGEDCHLCEYEGDLLETLEAALEGEK